MIKASLSRFNEFINTRTPREKKMLLILAVCGFLVLDYLLFINPVQNIFSQTMPRLGPLKQELRSLKEDVRDRELIRTQWEKTRAQAERIDRRLVAASDVSAAIEYISKLAGDAKFRIASIRPEAPEEAQPGAVYASMPIQLNGSAGTHAIGLFLAALESDPVFFKVTDLKILQDPEDGRNHRVEVRLEVYRST